MIQRKGTANGFTTYNNQFLLNAGTHRWSDGASTTKHSFVSQRLLDGRWPPASTIKDKKPRLLSIRTCWLCVFGTDCDTHTHKFLENTANSKTWTDSCRIEKRHHSPYGCFLKWWYPQNTPKWSFLVGKPMVVGYHHFRKPPYIQTFCDVVPRQEGGISNWQITRSSL